MSTMLLSPDAVKEALLEAIPKYLQANNELERQRDQLKNPDLSNRERAHVKEHRDLCRSLRTKFIEEFRN